MAGQTDPEDRPETVLCVGDRRYRRGPKQDNLIRNLNGTGLMKNEEGHSVGGRGVEDRGLCHNKTSVDVFYGKVVSKYSVLYAPAGLGA